MTRHSLRFRLLAAAAGSTLLALILAGFSLVTLFEHHLERRFNSELATYTNQLVGRIDADQQGRIHVHGNLADPRFEEPLSGLYWQIQDDTHRTLLRSRSLWDNKLDLPKDELSLGDVHHHTLAGPDGQPLMVSERQVILEPDTLGRRVRVAVARNRGDLDAAREAFARDMLPYFALLAIFLMAASWVQVRTGLAPLEQLRRGVLSIRRGRLQRLQGPYPDEVTPLVDEINELLEMRDRMVENARSWTADLAHGLKTPLSALAADAQRLRNAGQEEVADDLDDLAQVMRRRVDRELIRARLRSSDTAVARQTDLTTAIQRILKTLTRTPEGQAKNWHAEMPDWAAVAMREDDLIELLGNLLDDAGKWARQNVWITVAPGSCIRLSIEDDGPGVPQESLLRLGERGLRLDEQIRGHGLGLAIVRDIVAAYEGTVEFTRSQHGGLAVHVCFAPAARH